MPTNSNETSMILKISMISMEKTIHILFTYSSVLLSIHGFIDFKKAFEQNKVWEILFKIVIP
jgi:hypothetical protein